MNQALCLKATVRLCTQDGQRCFGPSIAAPLEQVRQCRSLQAAAASTAMACSKTWKIVRTAENAFGRKPTTGGKHGGAVPTARTERLLAAYQDYAASVEQFSQRRFQEAFGFCRDAGTDKEAE